VLEVLENMPLVALLTKGLVEIHFKLVVGVVLYFDCFVLDKEKDTSECTTTTF